MKLKNTIYEYCRAYVSERINTAEQAIASLQTSAQGEIKSSAGDKFETSREMIKQEIERNQQLLFEAVNMKTALDNLQLEMSNPGLVVSGCVVHTDHAKFYLSVGIGRVRLDHLEIYVISPASPVGKLLVGKRVGESVQFNGRTYTIQNIE